MTFYVPETICAIATAPGRAGIAVLRLSGQHLIPLAQTLTGGKTPRPRYAMLTDFLAADGTAMDNGLLLYFPAPHSFTGEDVLELHGHGGTVVMNRLLTRCIELGARMAQPGEFTQRAFLNGKLDLAQAESVADLIDAASEAAAKSALRSLQGVFSQHLQQLTEQLITLRMLIEATLDFPEEEIDFLVATDAHTKLSHLRQQLEQLATSARQGVILREGMHVVLIGQPNVGKSSLMNALAGEEVAIVTDIAGTTRDTVRESIIIDGVPMHIIDTAGLRDTTDIVEQRGIERTWQAVARADIALLLLDNRDGITHDVNTILTLLPDALPRLFVFNKIDLSAMPPSLTEYHGHPAIHLSALTHAGIDLLKAKLLELIGFHTTTEDVFLARTRHLDAIRRAHHHLILACQDWHQTDIVAEELRMAQSALGEITGEFSSDDLLGVIFSRFCIGK